MTFFDRLLTAVSIVRRKKTLLGRIRITTQLISTVLGNRFYRFFPALSAGRTRSQAWSEYFLLLYTNRDIDVRVSSTEGPKIWFLVPDLDPRIIFGGYIALYYFIQKLQSEGREIGLIVPRISGDKQKLLQIFEKHKVVRDVIAKSTIQPLRIDRPLHLGAGDALVAYNWTTALIAKKAARQLNDPKYHYFVQEDERIFYAHDSTRYLVESVFHPSPRLICNSSRLRNHFVSEGLITQDDECVVFEQGIPDIKLPAAAELTARTRRKFLFYGRPEIHAKRNLFTIAILALEQAMGEGVFDEDDWDFFMMGSSAMYPGFEIAGRKVTCLPRMSYEDYLAALPGFDLGMSLMYGPHPSVPPFEMVRAGIPTVVNTWRDRDADWYSGVSGNFIPAAPTIGALVSSLRAGTVRAKDGSARIDQAKTYHPTTWNHSFDHVSAALSHQIFASRP